MDILGTDPLTHLGMTNNILSDVLPLITQYQVPILTVGGGGYQPDDTARGWALAWTLLACIDTETDMYVGLGGKFLGSTEWEAGLRDIHSYRSGEEKQQILHELGTTVDEIIETIFPLHGIHGS